jgi:hypothetical protein
VCCFVPEAAAQGADGAHRRGISDDPVGHRSRVCHSLGHVALARGERTAETGHWGDRERPTRQSQRGTLPNVCAVPESAVPCW